MNQSGFGAIFILIAVLIASSFGGYVYLKQNPEITPRLLPINKTERLVSQSDSLKLAVSPTPTTQHQTSPTPAKIPTTKPLPKPSPTSTPTPTVPVKRTIAVSGFTYEDRNDDGIFNSDDVKLPNMSIKYSDSTNPDPAWDIFTDQGGNFSVSLSVKGNLVIDPKTYNNFRPRDGALRFSSNSTNVAVPFRSASAPVVNQSGVLEGDIFNDQNGNNAKDNGENGVYFYKLYLQDENGNYYNTVEDAQATDSGGHFKYVNLPIGKGFTITLSNPTGDYTIRQTTYNFTLTNTTPTISNITIPVIKN